MHQYYYASKFSVPVIPCFIEIQETKEKETDDFYKVEYTLHVLDPIYPDEEKSVKENTTIMMQKDYEQKKQAYEKIYHKKLTYNFEYSDIAGYIH